MTLSETQDRSLSLLPIIPVILSIVGSSTIISSVIRSRNKGPYERIMLGMSASDIVMSNTLALQPFLAPKGSYAMAVGNEASCSAGGTLFQIGSSSLFYYGSLTYYYLLTIRFNYSKRRLTHFAEPFMHSLSVGWPLITAFVGTGVGWYGPLSLFQGCWIDDYPKGCGTTKTKVKCLAPMISWICAGAPVIFVMFSLIINNILVYRHVYKVYNRRRFNRDSFSGSLDTAQSSQDKRIRLVATQAFLYVLAFFLTYACFVILQVLEGNKMGKKRATLYPLLVLQALLTPMAGFFNGLIFLRPRYLEIRSLYFDQTRYWALRRALFGASVRPVVTSSMSMDRQIVANVSIPPFGTDTSRVEGTLSTVDMEEKEEKHANKSSSEEVNSSHDVQPSTVFTIATETSGSCQLSIDQAHHQSLDRQEAAAKTEM